MAAPQGRPNGLLDRWVAPRALLAGVAVAFLACCLLGRLVSRSNPYKNFCRFHSLINTQTLYYPTASQVRALGNATLERDRIAVVVGSNSILVGHGQNARRLWSRRLQELLGDRYRVINLATRGARPWEFGGLAAEMLVKDHPRLVFVSCLRSIDVGDRPDGNNYVHFFWDAYCKGLVPPDEGREAQLKELVARQKDDAAFKELRLRMRIDGVAYANDLWTTVAYRHVNTVWCPGLADNFLQPRVCYADPVQRSTALEKRFLPKVSAAELPAAVGVAMNCDPDRTVRGCARNFTAELRGRTCMLVMHICPHYLRQLAPDLRARYDGFFPQTVRGLKEAGFAAAEVGRDFAEADYVDWCHLSEDGGDKMAAQVAEEVRALSRRLGYLGAEDGSAPLH